MSVGKMTVMIVEDNPGDVFLLEEMLKDIELDLNVMVIDDGKQAVSVLMREWSSTPDLVILDLNLPRMNGFDVLAYMKSSPALSDIPVIVMTGSLRDEDEVRARCMGVADYCLKPATSIEIERTMGCLKGQLEIIYCNRGRNDGPSTKKMSNLFASGECWAPPSCDERFIMDDLNNREWNMWN